MGSDASTMRARVPRALMNTGLVLGAIACALLVAELAVRVLGFDPDKQSLRPSAVALVHLNRSERSHDFALGQRAAVEIRTNRLALRDWDHPEDEATRILGLGDSFTFGFGVELEESYLSVAERALWERAPNARIGIHKVGVSGSSQHVQFEALKEHWSSIRPKMVVLGFSEDTDIDENVVQDPILHRLLAGEEVSGYSRALAKDFLHRNSALVRYFEARKFRVNAARDIAALERVMESWGARPGLEDLVRAGWQRRFIDAFGTKLDAEWRVTELLLDKLRTYVESNGAELVLMRIPSRYAVDPVAWGEAVRNVCGEKPDDVDATCGRVDSNHTAKRLRDYADAHHLSYVDPAPVLAEAIATGVPAYFRPPEIHWTREGHATAGLVLARALSDKLKLPAMPNPQQNAKKTRRFGAFWSSPAGPARSVSWIPSLQNDPDRARSQTLLWAEEARIDFLVVPITLGEGNRWTMDRETETMVQRIVDQRREELTRIGVAFQILPPAKQTIGAEALNQLLKERIDPSGAAYAQVCGKPLLFVDRATALNDNRFTVIRGTFGTATKAGNASCREEFPVGEPNCAESASIARLCVDDVRAGKGFAGDPDLLLASSFNGLGKARIEPLPPEGRVTTALVGEAVGRWKEGEAGTRAPSALALLLYRAQLHYDTNLIDQIVVPVTSDALSCNGCYDIESGPAGDFRWTADEAQFTLTGLAPQKKYLVTLVVTDAGMASRATLLAEGGVTDDVLLPGDAAWRTPLSSAADGTLRWTVKVKPFHPSDREQGSPDERLLGIGVGAVRVAAERPASAGK